MNGTDEAMIQTMVHYLETILEQPHPVFGGLPICPFSKKARLQNKILYKVIDLAEVELHPDSELLHVIRAFQATQYDVLLIISPNHCALTVEQVQLIVEHLNHAIAPLGLVSFGGHPHDTFNIQGIHTRQEPFINLTIQSMTKLQAASTHLKRTDYYQHWSEENLRQVGFYDRNSTEPNLLN